MKHQHSTLSVSHGTAGRLAAAMLFAALLLAGSLIGQAVPRLAFAQEPQSPVLAVPRGKKLFLRDGRFLMVRSYEQKADRVRFYSVERSQWEEIPAELVDWDATRRAEEEEARSQQELLEKTRDAEKKARAESLDVDASIEVAPGLFLPEGEGAFAVEGSLIVPLGSVGADVKRDKGRLLTQILVPIPVIPTRHRIQIQGKRATARLTSREPEFYIRTADTLEPEIEVVRARVKGDAREIQVVDTDIVGEQYRRGDPIAVQRWPVARGVYRLTMAHPLDPGEYAILRILPDKAATFYVWDFAIDLPAAAPAKKK
jgi:hypothetical protein